MDRNNIFKSIQNAVSDIPLLMIGSGSSAAHGLPGMKELGDHLLTRLNAKYTGIACWDTFQENIKNGQDLETALSDITFTNEMLADVKCETWRLISSKDIALLKRILFRQEDLPLAKVIKKFSQAHPRKLDIITTNYDRVVEYACDLAGVPVATGFSGSYLKQFSEGTFQAQNIVNLMKVHGSLDVFRDSLNAVISVPLQSELPVGLTPEIITPGRSKYEAILQGIPRQVLSVADSKISQARGFLCIGYGFNDTQVQENILTQIRRGIPIVVLTKKVFDHAAHLLANNAKQYISIQEGRKPNTTEICINKVVETIDGTLWTIDGFMSIID